MNIGDIVRLKSGGPEMTVVKADGIFANCSWFFNGHNSESLFPEKSLVPVDDSEVITVDGVRYKQLNLFND